jgi:hypothetical protein
MWDDGEFEEVSAVGVMLMVGLFVLTLALRAVGFARGVRQVR